MGRQGYSPEFRRKVLELIASRRSEAAVGHDLYLSDQTIYNWLRPVWINRGEAPGLSRAEKGELAKTDKRILEFETELVVVQRAVELVQEETAPEVCTRRSK